MQEDDGTPHYHQYPKPQELIRDAEALYHYLALWLNTAEWDSRIDPHYERIGRTRRIAGIPLSEVIRATMLAKRTLWDRVSADRKLSIQLELEACKAIGMFYDRAIYYTVVGYESGADPA